MSDLFGILGKVLQEVLAAVCTGSHARKKGLYKVQVGFLRSSI